MNLCSRILISALIFLSGLARADQTCGEIQPALDAAAEIRGLSYLTSPKCAALSRQDFRALNQRLINADLDQASLAYEGLALSYLGTVPGEFKYSECLADLLSTNAAATYSAKTKQFYVAAWSKLPNFILVHEAVHALQDQHFGVSHKGERPFIFSDFNLAWSALLEGDAMSVEGEYIRRAQKRGEQLIDLDQRDRLAPSNAECVMPEGLRTLFDAPYDYGAIFVTELKRRLGAKALDLAMLNPPSTTEQLLHIDKFVEREVPSFTQQALPQRLRIDGMEHRLKFNASLGELGIRLWLKSFLPASQAILAAKGWDGDMLGVYEAVDRERAVVFNWWLAWDSAAAAERFYMALTAMFNQRFGLILDSKARRIRFSAGKFKAIQIEFTSDRIVSLTIS